MRNMMLSWRGFAVVVLGFVLTACGASPAPDNLQAAFLEGGYIL
jgi:hypothetical protein